MKRVALLGVLLTLVAVTGASASSSPTLHGEGLTLSLPAGWHGLVGGAGVQAADFPLGSRVRSSAGLARVRRGHVHLIVFNYGPWVPYLPDFHPARTPLVLRRSDLVHGAMEGFQGDDTFARRNVRVGGEMLDVTADLGPTPDVASALRKVNAALRTMRVLPPQVLHPRRGGLASDGVSLRLLDGWSGWVEIPADRYGARAVLRARHGNLRVTLLETTEAPTGDHVDLPVAVRSHDVVHRYVPPLAHRVFSNGGRVFDLSVTVPSASALRAANELLETLKVVPRPWTFRGCDLALHVPGSWRVAIRPRNGCYPVLELRGPRVLVVLRELRPGQPASGRVLRRAGRRFEVEVAPKSARARAHVVLAGLRVKPRS